MGLPKGFSQTSQACDGDRFFGGVAAAGAGAGDLLGGRQPRRRDVGEAELAGDVGGAGNGAAAADADADALAGCRALPAMTSRDLDQGRAGREGLGSCCGPASESDNGGRVAAVDGTGPAMVYVHQKRPHICNRIAGQRQGRPRPCSGDFVKQKQDGHFLLPDCVARNMVCALRSTERIVPEPL